MDKGTKQPNSANWTCRIVGSIKDGTLFNSGGFKLPSLGIL